MTRNRTENFTKFYVDPTRVRHESVTEPSRTRPSTVLPGTALDRHGFYQRLELTGRVSRQFSISLLLNADGTFIRMRVLKTLKIPNPPVVGTIFASEKRNVLHHARYGL